MRSQISFDEFLAHYTFDLTQAANIHPNPESLRAGVQLFYQFFGEMPVFCGDLKVLAQQRDPLTCAKIIQLAQQHYCSNIMVINAILRFPAIDLLHACLTHLAEKNAHLIPNILEQLPTPQVLSQLVTLFNQPTTPRLADIDACLQANGDPSAWREAVDDALRLLRKRGLHTAALETLILDHASPYDFANLVIFLMGLPYAVEIPNLLDKAFAAPNRVMQVLAYLNRAQLLNATRCDRLLSDATMANRLDQLFIYAPSLCSHSMKLLDADCHPALPRVIDLALSRYSCPALLCELLQHTDPVSAEACLRGFLLTNPSPNPAVADLFKKGLVVKLVRFADRLTPYPQLLPLAAQQPDIIAVLDVINEYAESAATDQDADTVLATYTKLLTYPRPDLLRTILLYTANDAQPSQTLIDTLLSTDNLDAFLPIFKSLRTAELFLLSETKSLLLLKHAKPECLAKCMHLLHAPKLRDNTTLMHKLASLPNLDEIYAALETLSHNNVLSQLTPTTLLQLFRKRNLTAYGRIFAAISIADLVDFDTAVMKVLSHPATTLLDWYLPALANAHALRPNMLTYMTQPLVSKRIPPQGHDETVYAYASRIFNESSHWRNVESCTRLLKILHGFVEIVPQRWIDKVWDHPQKMELIRLLKAFTAPHKIDPHFITEILELDHWLASENAAERVKALVNIMREAGQAISAVNFAIVLASSRPEHRLQQFMLQHPQRNPDAQNTHTRSINRSASASAQRLVQRYQIPSDQTALQPMIDALVAWGENLIHPNHAVVKRALKQFMNHENRYEDPLSKITLTQLLVGVFQATQDSATRLTNQEDAEAAFIAALYECQRGYNQDADGEDLGDSHDLPICLSGAFNKLVGKMVSVHPDCLLIFLTHEEAGKKLKILSGKTIATYFATLEPQQQRAALEAYAHITTQETTMVQFWEQIEATVGDALFEDFGELYDHQREHPQLKELLITTGPYAIIEFLDQRVATLQASNRGLFSPAAVTSPSTAPNHAAPTP